MKNSARIIIALTTLSLGGCASTPEYRSPIATPAAADRTRQKACYDKMSPTARKAYNSIREDMESYDFYMKAIQYNELRGSHNLKYAEAIYKRIVGHDKTLSGEMGDCYKSLGAYDDIKKSIARYENMPEDIKKAMRNYHTSSQAQAERDEKVNNILATTMKPYKSGDVEARLVQVQNNRAIVEISAVGHKIVPFNPQRIIQDQITGEYNSYPTGITLSDNYGNEYRLTDVKVFLSDDSEIEARNGTIRPGASVKLIAIFRESPVESKELLLKISKYLVGEEMSFRIPTEIWLMQPDTSKLEK